MIHLVNALRNDTIDFAELYENANLRKHKSNKNALPYCMLCQGRAQNSGISSAFSAHFAVQVAEQELSKPP